MKVLHQIRIWLLIKTNVIHDLLQNLPSDTRNFEHSRLFTLGFPGSATELQISSSDAISGLTDTTLIMKYLNYAQMCNSHVWNFYCKRLSISLRL